jgi:TonB family protein
MRRGLISATLQVALMGVCSVALMAETTTAQGTMGEATQENVPVLTHLATPVYPPLARQAHITGDVVVRVSIRQDGSVESAEVVSGHRMLSPVALDSAQHSTFECRGCSSGTTRLLTYSFEMYDECPQFDNECSGVQLRSPEVKQVDDRIVLKVEPACTCDPVAKIVGLRVRSAKCFYLWRCGLHRVED